MGDVRGAAAARRAGARRERRLEPLVGRLERCAADRPPQFISLLEPLPFFNRAGTQLRARRLRRVGRPRVALEDVARQDRACFSIVVRRGDD